MQALLRTCVALLCGLLLSPLAFDRSGDSLAQAPTDAKPYSIPLNDIYSTSNQEGMQNVYRKGEQVQESLEEIYTRSNWVNTSNLFMVRGDNIAEALHATKRVFVGRCPADVPGGAPGRIESASIQQWLVVYLGSGSGDLPIYKAVSAEQSKSKIKFEFRRMTNLIQTDDIHQYFYWIPLKKIDSPDFLLDMYDTELKTSVLTRRVKTTIPNK